MIAVQLDLFTGREVAPSFEGARDYEDAAMRAGILDLILNPCAKCSYCGICDSDDCAMHLFDLDVDELISEEEDDEDDMFVLEYV